MAISLYAEVRGFPATDTRRPGGGLDESQEIIAERATWRCNYLSAAWHVVFWQPEGNLGATRLREPLRRSVTTAQRNMGSKTKESEMAAAPGLAGRSCSGCAPTAAAK